VQMAAATIADVDARRYRRDQPRWRAPSSFTVSIEFPPIFVIVPRSSSGQTGHERKNYAIYHQQEQAGLQKIYKMCSYD